MARVTLQANFSHAGVNYIKQRVEKDLIKTSKEIADDYSKRVINVIKLRAKKVRENESMLWEALGQAAFPQPGAFGEISGKLKKSTGFVITLNGVRIASSNTIVGDTPVRKARIKGKEFSPHKKQNNQYIRNFAVGIAIFSTAPYADAVNNPERKKLKNYSLYKGKYRDAGELYAGTGWFDIYTTFLTNMFYNSFLGNEMGNNINRSQITSYEARFRQNINGNTFQTQAIQNATYGILNVLTHQKGNGKINFPNRYIKGSNGKKGYTKHLAKPFVVKNLNIDLNYDKLINDNILL